MTRGSRQEKKLLELWELRDHLPKIFINMMAISLILLNMDFTAISGSNAVQREQVKQALN